MLSQVKTAKYDLTLLETELRDILKNYILLNMAPSLQKMEVMAVYQPAVNMSKHGFPDHAKELLYFKDLIDKYTYKDLLKVILSRSARSAAL